MQLLSFLVAFLLFACFVSPAKSLSNYVDKFKVLKNDGHQSKKIPSRDYQIRSSIINKPKSGSLQSSPASMLPSKRFGENERIQKYIARAGICSRRNAEKLVRTTISYKIIFMLLKVFNIFIRFRREKFMSMEK